MDHDFLKYLSSLISHNINPFPFLFYLQVFSRVFRRRARGAAQEAREDPVATATQGRGRSGSEGPA